MAGPGGALRLLALCFACLPRPGHSSCDQGEAALNQGSFKVAEECQPVISRGELPCSFRLGAPAFPDLHCYTDYETKVACHWPVRDTTDCAKEFTLLVKTNTEHQPECCLENRRIAQSASPSCVCSITETSFSGTKYSFLLATRTNITEICSVYLNQIVTPRALRNLTVTKSKRSFTLAWNKINHSIFNVYKIVHQIEISADGSKTPALLDVTQQTDRYEVFPAALSAGKNHTARVRYRIPDLDTCWSEWSSPSHWLNDFKPDPGGQSWWPIPVICCLVAVLILSCYCCLVRLKQQWWDQIPRPKIDDNLGKKPGPLWWQTPPRDEGQGLLWPPSQDLLARQLSRKESPPEDGVAFPSRPCDNVATSVPGRRPRGKWEAILTPEDPPVELSLTVCSPAADPDAETPVEDKEGLASHDDALARLFLNILGGGDGTEDAAPPEPPPATAPEPALEGLGGTPSKSLGELSDSVNGIPGTPSSRAASPAPEQPFSSLQYKWLLFPQPGSPGQALVTESIGGSQAGGPGGGVATATPRPSCYRNLSSLMGQPRGPSVDQVLNSVPPGREEELLLSPPQQDSAAIPCPPDSCLPGYRPLRPASQEPQGLGSGSPYKPLLEVFSSTAKEGPLEAGRETWAGGPWPETLALAFSRCMEGEGEGENGSGQVGIRPGTEGSLPIASF